MKNQENPQSEPREGNLLKNAARAVGTAIAKVGSTLGLNRKKETPVTSTSTKRAASKKAAPKKIIRKKTGRKR